MQNVELINDNSESQDYDAVTTTLTGHSIETKNHINDEDSKHIAGTTTISSSSASASASCQSSVNAAATSGYYDAEKCRAHIANQSRVSKIDRFAIQVNRAIEVETNVHLRLANVLTMFLKRTAQIAHDFTMKCKLGSQRHRQDRILYQSKRSAKRQQQQNQNQHQVIMPAVNISNDLLYGHGAQLVHELLSQPMLLSPPQLPKFSRRKKIKHESANEVCDPKCLEQSQPKGGSELFEPSLFVDKLEDHIRSNIKRSRAITSRLVTLQRLFKNMAAEHRSKVDLVYAAEEERQASTVIRRSAYNLSVAAIKATSTPMST